MKTNNLKCIAFVLVAILLSMCSSKGKVTKEGDKDKLIGVWGPSINENASFRIQKDSIYYPEYFKSFKYTTTMDSIFIHYDGWIFKGVFYFMNDSLVLKTKNKENRYVRIVN